MKHISNSQDRTKSRQLAKLLAKNGCRLFSISDARKVSLSGGLDLKSINEAVFRLLTQGWIHMVKRNLYELDPVLMGGLPVHEFEIATYLVKPSAISHFSAFHVHELTDQIPQIVYASAPTGSSLPRTQTEELFSYKGVRYQFISVRKAHFFGIELIWIGEAQIPITDLERTLLDGLTRPKYCGGFMEVLHAFTRRDFVIKKIVDYALRLDVSVAKRLGWVLEKIGYTNDSLEPLLKLPIKGFVKLDASEEKTGQYNKRWQIQENI